MAIPKIPTPPKMGTTSKPSSAISHGECMSYLMACAVQVHIYHLRAKGSGAFAAHMALGSLYDSLPDLVDSLAESMQGKYGLLNYDYSHSFDSNYMNALPFVKKCLAYVETERKSFPQDTYIQNQIDEIVALFYSTIYKLENLQ